MEERISGTDEVTCPWCGVTSSDSWEFGDSGNIECDECGNHFFFEREISVTYINVKLYKGECPLCNQTKVLSEHTKIDDKYVPVCEECRIAEDIARCKSILEMARKKEQ